MKLERNEGSFSIDATLLGELLNVPASGVQALMRQKKITSLCERGDGDHAGQFRLTFFYKGRRVRLNLDQSGEVIRRSIVDIGDQPLPSTTHGQKTPSHGKIGVSGRMRPADQVVATGIDVALAVELPSSPASASPFLDDLKSRRDNSARGMSITFVDKILPKARDRLVTIAHDAPLTEAAERLYEPRCRMVIVCDRQNAMIGVITRTDIIRRIRHCQGCVCAAQCMMVMTKHVIFCRPQDRLDDTWAVMKARGLHSMPVIDTKRRPIGLLSARDALQALLDSVEYEESLLRDYVMCVGYR